MSSRVRNSGEFPEGYVPFRQIHEELPDPELFSVSEAVTLEALHLPGPEPEIVFIHGGLGSLWNPFPQLYVFRGEQGLLTYALAGNGGSSTRPEQTIEGHVADLKNLTDRLGVDRPLVHGHSYGTAIAIEYAKEYPCRGVVLHAGGDHDLTPPWEKPLLQLFLALRLYRVFPETALMRALARWAACHEETPQDLVEDFLQSNPIPRRRSAWKTVTEAFWGYDGRPDIDRVEVPALVIHGPADRIVPMEVARGTARRLPHGDPFP
ncbi:pimeloyl-ACP methyl ester carboxylesterase [Salinibacter ruber]|uniref:Pimeloyl-ACP methyl ester carboxylesterase n=2 Tax=Salinibacter ruber TaxID=146919 RepID=A0A9X2PVF2_9BACT|nr:pimeloyl-ACP methyl ester carboxylesterase [Salinibacter ruber]MCS3679565.1 pimeloyl-ACP methyl ester carboxylesterase [Salinibacter ruber]